jgi:hypothetical protein
VGRSNNLKGKKGTFYSALQNMTVATKPVVPLDRNKLHENQAEEALGGSTAGGSGSTGP